MVTEYDIEQKRKGVAHLEGEANNFLAHSWKTMLHYESKAQKARKELEELLRLQKENAPMEPTR